MTAILPNLFLAIAAVTALALVCRLPYRFAADERAGLRLARSAPRRRPIAEHAFDTVR